MLSALGALWIELPLHQLQKLSRSGCARRWGCCCGCPGSQGSGGGWSAQGSHGHFRVGGSTTASCLLGSCFVLGRRTFRICRGGIGRTQGIQRKQDGAWRQEQQQNAFQQEWWCRPYGHHGGRRHDRVVGRQEEPCLYEQQCRDRNLHTRTPSGRSQGRKTTQSNPACLGGISTLGNERD